MRLSIVNYGVGIDTDIPSHAKREDKELTKKATEIVEARNFGKGAIIVSEVMHTDLVNLNNRSYMTKGMGDSVTTFFYPHFTPFLMHHDSGSGMFGGDSSLLAVGSNIFGKFFKRKVETTNGTASGYIKVATFIGENTKIGDTLAIDALRSRQLLTLSIGSRVSDENYRCSICDLSIYNEECEHNIGKDYDGEMCYAKIYSPFFREYSAVYNPSDINAIIRSIDIEEKQGGSLEDHVVDMGIGIGNIHIYDVSHPIYPSVNMENTEESNEKMKNDKNTEEQENQEDNENLPIEESADLLDDKNKQIEELKDSEKQLNQIIEKLELKVEEKDKLIAVLAKALNSKLDDEELEGSEPEGEDEDNGDEDDPESEDNGEEETPADDSSSEDDNNIEDDSNVTEVMEEDGSSEDIQEDTSDSPSTDEDPVKESEQEKDDQNESDPATGSHDERPYKELLTLRRKKFGVLSTSSIGKRGSKKFPSKINI